MSKNQTGKESVNNIGRKLADVFVSALTSENVQMYLLGTKKSGKPRSVYDIMKERSKKDRKKRKKNDTAYSVYRDVKRNGKKKKKKNDKYWKY